MQTPLLFPMLGAMSSGTLSSWVAEDGEPVSKGQLLYYVEHGDLILEIEAPADGRLHVIGSPGVTYKFGDTIGSID